METNSKLSTGDFPAVIDKIPELEFREVQYINFDNITFE